MRVYKIISTKRRQKCNKISFLTQIGGGQNRLKPKSHFTHSHKLPKIALSLALLLSGANVALAEESGGFIGLGIGGGGTAFKMKGDGFNQKTSRSGLNYGFVGGYKQFFTPNLGLRYYVNLDLHHNMEKLKGETTAFEAILVNYGANVDFLGNFVSNETLDFGGFIGLGLGANTLTGKDIENMKKGAKESSINLTTTGFDVWLNVGLRTNIATHHGLEVAVKVPFLPIAMANMEGAKYTFGQEYSVLARYTFSF